MKGGTMKRETQLTLQDKTSEYAVELPTLWYDRTFVENHLNSIEQDDWYIFDCGHVRWTVHEAYENNPRLECKNYVWTQFHQELAELFNVPIMPDTMLYTATPIGGVPPHQDRNRLAILNFAVRGEFGNTSPQTFYDDFDRETHIFNMEYVHSKSTNEFAPWLFKGSKVHGVQNTNDPDRAILSCCWRHHSYEDILQGINNGTLINWEANEKNKLVRFV
jgi:hypothetical protein|tara:strand:+ start:136 stop:792 length:657 start_codon:yes stop_codon:yes gene_type:complete